MKLKELITKLLNYNMDADVYVMAHNKDYEFTLAYGGGSEGGMKNKATSISFYVDELRDAEKTQYEKVVIEKAKQISDTISNYGDSFQFIENVIIPTIGSDADIKFWNDVVKQLENEK